VLTTVQSREQCLSCVGCGAALGRGLCSSFRPLSGSPFSAGLTCQVPHVFKWGRCFCWRDKQLFRLRGVFAAFFVPFGDFQALRQRAAGTVFLVWGVAIRVCSLKAVLVLARLSVCVGDFAWRFLAHSPQVKNLHAAGSVRLE
ncbi:unnamed protein product, partial [Ectocarpus sp. 13 AM-2016]